MKIDIIVGNPPYQLYTRNDNSGSAKPFYHLFIKNSCKIAKYVCMIVPSRFLFYTQRIGLKDFREWFLKCNKIRSLTDYNNENNIFKNRSIKGGVCHFLYDDSYNGPCNIISHIDNKLIESRRYLYDSSVPLITFIRDYKEIEFINKVLRLKDKSFSEIVSSRNLYKIPSNFLKKMHKNLIYLNENTKLIKIYIYDCNKRLISGYLPFNLINNIYNTNYDKYKIFVNNLNEIEFVRIILAKPYEICSESFIEIGPFDTYEQMKNCADYMRTNFFKKCLKILMKTKNLNKEKFRFVPLQDFNEIWDDNKLCKKYNLIL